MEFFEILFFLYNYTYRQSAVPDSWHKYGVMSIIKRGNSEVRYFLQQTASAPTLYNISPIINQSNSHTVSPYFTEQYPQYTSSPISIGYFVFYIGNVNLECVRFTLKTAANKPRANELQYCCTEWYLCTEILIHIYLNYFLHSMLVN